MSTAKPHRAEAFIQRLENEQRQRLTLVKNDAPTPQPAAQQITAHLAAPMRTGFAVAAGIAAAGLGAFVGLVALLMLIANAMR